MAPPDLRREGDGAERAAGSIARSIPTARPDEDLADTVASPVNFQGPRAKDQGTPNSQPPTPLSSPQSNQLGSWELEVP